MSTDADTLDLVSAVRQDMGRWGYGAVPQRSLLFTARITTTDQLAAAEQALGRSVGPGRQWHALATIFSRYVVGWTVAAGENAELARSCSPTRSGCTARRAACTPTAAPP